MSKTRMCAKWYFKAAFKKHSYAYWTLQEAKPIPWSLPSSHSLWNHRCDFILRRCSEWKATFKRAPGITFKSALCMATLWGPVRVRETAAGKYIKPLDSGDSLTLQFTVALSTKEKKWLNSFLFLLSLIRNITTPFSLASSNWPSPGSMPTGRGAGRNVPTTCPSLCFL